VGKKLGVHEVASELLPEGKLQYVKRLAAASHTVAMVGDGGKRCPALAQATVGVAMGSERMWRKRAQTFVLIGSDLSKLVETLRIARRCRRTIMQNFVGTLVVDTIGVAWRRLACSIRCSPRSSMSLRTRIHTEFRQAGTVGDAGRRIERPAAGSSAARHFSKPNGLKRLFLQSSNDPHCRPS